MAMLEPNDMQRERSSRANQTKGQSNVGNSGRDIRAGDVLPHSGEAHRNEVLFAPTRLRRSDGNADWDGRGVPPQTRTRNAQASTSDRRGCDQLDSAGLFRLGHKYGSVDPLKGYGDPSTFDNASLDKGVVSGGLIPNHLATPKYDALVVWCIGVIACCFAFYLGTAVAR